MRIKRALLIVPPTGEYIREDRCQTPIEDLKTVSLRPPIDLLYIAASLERCGVECSARDYPAGGGGWDRFRLDLEDTRPDLLILSITTPSLIKDMKAATLAKEVLPEIVVGAKGAHFLHSDIATLEAFPALDFCFRGEYELIAPDIVSRGSFECVRGISYRHGDRIKRNPDRPLIEDLDAIPYPARHLIENSLYVRPDLGTPQTNIVTSRGCPFECVFCLAPVISGRKLRRRSPQNILGEIRECVEKFSIRDFLFRSDLFTADHQWTMALCRAILESGMEIRWSCNSRVDTLDPDLLSMMKRAGCWLIAFGVESGSEMMLEKMKKKVRLEEAGKAIRLCRRAGIRSSVYLLLGLPWETEETFRASRQFARDLSPDFLEVFYAYPFEGTQFHELAVKKGLLDAGEYPLNAYAHPSIPSIHLSLCRLAEMRREMLRAYYLRPKYILRTLLQTRSPRMFLNYLRYGWAQFWDLIAGGPGSGSTAKRSYRLSSSPLSRESTLNP